MSHVGHIGHAEHVGQCRAPKPHRALETVAHIHGSLKTRRARRALREYVQRDVKHAHQACMVVHAQGLKVSTQGADANAYESWEGYRIQLVDDVVLPTSNLGYRRVGAVGFEFCNNAS